MLQLKSMKKIFAVLLFFSVFFIFPSSLFADDFQTEYQIEYFLDQQNSSQTKAKITISVANLRSDAHLQSFSLGFPADFSVYGIAVSADTGSASYDMLQKGDQTVLVIKLKNEKTKRGDMYTVYIEFFQENIFQINGAAAEFLAPVMESAIFDSKKIIVHTAGRKADVIKPQPHFMDVNTVVWENPKKQLMYAIFGNKQYYSLDLAYHIANTKLTSVFTEIALPPQTQAQKIYVESIRPGPDSAYIDTDGNYIARYNLAPKEKKTIVFKGFAEVQANPGSFSLSGGVRDIYQTVVNSPLDTSREFSREFIRLVREKGIRAREIQGFAAFFHPKLRPISLVSDNIHSWVELYDSKIGAWIPLDPMWEHATGIDYAPLFDMNHVSFVIHETHEKYPLPAGTYKWENSKDVSVQAITKLPEKKIRLSDKMKEFSEKKNLLERIADFLKSLRFWR